MVATIFVFGANEQGAHEKGSALFARRHRGAIYGQASGRQGDSYAIPTKNALLHPLPLPTIQRYVDEFLTYARDRPEEEFELTTAIGCGPAGYKPDQIGPMFRDAPPNVRIPYAFRPYMAQRSKGPNEI